MNFGKPTISFKIILFPRLSNGNCSSFQEFRFQPEVSSARVAACGHLISPPELVNTTARGGAKDEVVDATLILCLDWSQCYSQNDEYILANSEQINDWTRLLTSTEIHSNLNPQIVADPICRSSGSGSPQTVSRSCSFYFLLTRCSSRFHNSNIILIRVINFKYLIFLPVNI